ncbi:MAG: trigger factor family protein [Sphaerochaetaceae bacterium]|nr:trigger factor family protein [Sphaerochaetaceae bacterium]
MSVQVENLEKNMAKLTIEVSAEELEKAIQAAYMKQKGQISLPGFRKGKVPRHMIEKMYGTEVFFEDAANTLEQIIDLSVENKKLSQDDIEKKYQKLISLLIKAENKEKAYEKALYLWNEGFISKENIEILYSLNPQKWETTFNAIL